MTRAYCVEDVVVATVHYDVAAAAAAAAVDSNDVDVHDVADAGC